MTAGCASGALCFQEAVEQCDSVWCANNVCSVSMFIVMNFSYYDVKPCHIVFQLTAQHACELNR